MTADIKARRLALGMSRAELSAAAYVDKRIIQLVELKQHADPVAEARLTRAMDALEAGDPLPDFKAEVDALKSKTKNLFLASLLRHQPQEQKQLKRKPPMMTSNAPLVTKRGVRRYADEVVLLEPTALPKPSR